MAKWARKAHSQVSKSFAMTRLNFGQGVGKGATYRQSALIPTYLEPVGSARLTFDDDLYYELCDLMTVGDITI